MSDFRINCEVIAVAAGATGCQKPADSFVIGPRTPAGMCSRAFAAVYPAALALRFSDEMAWQKGTDCLEITCPDGHVIYRLKREGPA
jgi:uncharacterized repeat protein (TIGR04076 family)